MLKMGIEDKNVKDCEIYYIKYFFKFTPQFLRSQKEGKCFS